MVKRKRSFETKLSEWVKQKTKDYDASHDVIHAANVVRLSKEIITHNIPKTKKYIKDAIVALSWTHDVCDKKYNANKSEAVEAVVKMCNDLEIDPRAVEIVKHVIGHISFSKRLSQGEPSELDPEEMIVYYAVSDADMLEAMGISGIVRTFMYQAVIRQPSTSALAHVEEKLFKCKENLFYEWAKNEGSVRHDVMVAACKELSRERIPT